MTKSITSDRFDFLAARAGVTLTPAQKAEIIGTYHYVAAMVQRNQKARGREAEPGAYLHPWRGGGGMSTEFITIAQASAKLAAKTVSPVELTKQCLAQIAALDSTLHSFITVTDDRALADAKAAEARIMAGTALGPLDGIPIGLKDIIDTKGILTTCQSAQLIGNVPGTDATCTVKLAEAGTVLMGKLSTHEFADGGPSFDLPWPPARNPWNPDQFQPGAPAAEPGLRCRPA